MSSSLSFRTVCSGALACAIFGVAFTILREGEQPGLAAASNTNRVDQDRDGLSDQQELLLGTLAFRADSDRDGYSDLEELARGSEPMNTTSRPESAPYAVGSCTSEENGYVRMLTSVYTEDGRLDNLRLAFGVLHRGRVIRLDSHDFGYQTGFVRPGSVGQVAVLEVGVPARLIRRLGRMHLFAVVGSRTPGSERLVTTESLANVGGFITSIKPMHAALSVTGSGGGAQGVVYRPLASSDDLTAAGWESGKVCFQRTAAVGSVGPSIVYEVDGADCIPMDTQCSPSECAAGIGTSIDMPDPGALIGG
jgi:hypothetical protein